MKFKVGDKVRIKNSPKNVWEITKIKSDYLGNKYVSCMINRNTDDIFELAWFENELEYAEDSTERTTIGLDTECKLTKDQVVKVVEEYFEWQLKTQVGLLAKATEDNNYEFINDYLKMLNNINNILNDIDLLAYRYKGSED